MLMTPPNKYLPHLSGDVVNPHGPPGLVGRHHHDQLNGCLRAAVLVLRSAGMIVDVKTGWSTFMLWK